MDQSDTWHLLLYCGGWIMCEWNEGQNFKHMTIYPKLKSAFH